MTGEPFRLQPRFHSMLWGGDRLRPLYGQPPSPDPVGEAWIVSDVDKHESVIATGLYSGLTLRDLIRQQGTKFLGRTPLIHGRFPLLLKLIDARTPLSVQVHPNDEQANAKRPGHNGKTEAWVVLDSDPAESLMYAGVRNGVREADFRKALAEKTVADTLHTFVPRPGDCIYLTAGTVHAIGAKTFLFEVQQTSDITYRLYDWDRVDAKTGKPRELHIDDGLACTNFAAGPCRPVTPTVEAGVERLVDGPYFQLSRRVISDVTKWPTADRVRCLTVVSRDGAFINGQLFKEGEVAVLPANGDAVTVLPGGQSVTILECVA